jgi:hypothetical protein
MARAHFGVDVQVYSPYDWFYSQDGSRKLTHDMHIIGSVTPLTDGTFMVTVNIADKFEVSIGAKKTMQKAQKALIKFLAIKQ